VGNMFTGSTKSIECAQREAGEAKRKAEKEAKERAGREAKEKAEQAAREITRREAKEREEAEKVIALASMVASAGGSTVGKDDRPRKISTLLQKERKSEWVGTCDLNSTEKEASGLPPMLTSSGPGGPSTGPVTSGCLGRTPRPAPPRSWSSALH
jgi:hypothetical protein